MATNSLGRLTLDMVVKLGNYMEGLDKAGRQAKKSGKEIESGLTVGSLAIKALGVAAAGISVAGITAFTSQTIEAGNEIKKFSQLANTSMRDFQYYSKGAATAGINIESFADKMKDMQDRIGDFQQTGGGPLADFFENIAPLVGVTIQQFQKLSGPDALQLYHDSLVKAGASQNDMKFYMEAIISDSSLLLPLLEQNGAGFKKWGDAAERTGAILSDDVVNSLALAKENLQMMDLQWQGVQANLINNVVPVFELVVDHMDDIKAVGGAVAVAMVAKFVPALIASTIQLGQLGVFAIRAGVGLIGLSGSAGVASTAMIALRGAVAFLGGPVGLAMLAFQGIAAGSAFLYLKNSSDDVDTSLSKQGKSVQELTVEYNKLSEAQQRAFKYQETVELKTLTEDYTKAQQQVRAYASSIAEVVAKDDATKNTIRGWIKEFDAQKISAEELANKINSLSNVGTENKTVMDKHSIAATGAKNAMVAQKKVVDSLDTANKQLARSHDTVTSSVNGQAQAYMTLTQKQRAVVNDLQQQALRESYINNNMARGWSRDQAEYFADKRSEAGESYTKALSKEMFVQIEAGYKLQQQTKSREESEKQIAEQKKKQSELAEKQYSFSQKEVEMLKKVSALNAKYDLDGIGAKQGLPKNLLAAVMAQESKGDINAKSPTGAIGPFQTTGIYRKEHGLSVADSYDIKKSAEAAAKAIAKSFEVFGNWNDAITAYNAGVSGTKSLKTNGFTGSNAKTKEAKGYAPMVNKWLVGLGGSANKDAGFAGQDAAASLKDWAAYQQDLEEIRQQALDRQKAVQQTYNTEEQQMADDHQEKLKAIAEAYAGDDSAIKKYTNLENQAYEKSISEYKQALTQKTFDEKKQLLEVRKNWMTASEYAQEYYALIRAEILETANYSPEMKDALLQKASSDQNFEQSYERDSAISDYKDVMGYEDSPLIRQFEVLDKMRELDLINEEKYQQDKLQLQAISTASYMEGMFGGFASMVDENSKTYAVLFAAQKAFAVAQAMLNIPAAYSKAYDAVIGTPYIGPYIAPVVGAAAAALQVAQAAKIKGIGLSGMAHDGIDNIPKEGTWLLDGGERVLNPQQNKDLTKYLNDARGNSQSSTQNVNLNPNFVIVDEREIMSDYLFSPDGTNSFV